MENTNWVSMWGNAVSIAEHHPESYAKDLTLRYPIYAPFAGDALRFTLDNYCGTEPVTITKAMVALAAFDLTETNSLSCPILPSTLATITFDGADTVTLGAKERITSDAIACSIPAGATLCVSLYFSDFTSMQSAVLITGPLSKGYFSFGNQTNTDELPMDTTKSTNWFYFLSNVSIHTSGKNHALICYGDSITAQAWPDDLTLRLRKEGICNTSVIRRAASGTRILREYKCITYDSYGLKGTNRFLHEVPTDGASSIIIQQGINDIIHPVGTDVNPFRPMSDLPTAQELIDGLKWYIESAHQMGLQVYLGTLLPIYGWRTYAPFREELKNEVNDWIRSTNEIEGYIDFANALCDSKNPAAFRSEYDSGDHLHPSKAGYQKMAELIPSALF